MEESARCRRDPSLSVVQKVDKGLLGGLLNGVLQVLKPLTISSSSGGLPVIAVG